MCAAARTSDHDRMHDDDHQHDHLYDEVHDRLHERLHDEEPDIGTGLVRRLISVQFPQWKGLPLAPVPISTTDNAMFRLGPELAVRLPRAAWAAGNLAREQYWLPRLAPHLPVPVPEPIGHGRPTAGYPWDWTVLRWQDGVTPAAGALADPIRLAHDLAGFITALRAVQPDPDAPPAARGGPLAGRDAATRAAIGRLRGVIDTEAAATLWDKALRLPEHTGPATWTHGDLSPGNLLVNAPAPGTPGGRAVQRLSAVLDFGLAGVGDPTVDLLPAWSLLPAAARPAFRTALAVDDATWERGRAWALSIALVQLPYYRTTNPPVATSARHIVREILADRSV
ncbi:aminoglycoside phosphotransferase family protein [Kitasatospora sp. NPDC093806]|uniref:aminoglycoside phosphotransferase family protein n=1 Tax=Kitasatospora sp. NPDC093806 TaxID=3155075 RepID=UPI00343392D6